MKVQICTSESEKGLYEKNRTMSTAKSRIRVKGDLRHTVGMGFKVARLETGMTQTELATRLEVSQDAVSSWERGISPPPIEAVRILGRMISPASRNELFAVTGVTDVGAELLNVELQTRTIGVLQSPQELGDPMAVAAYTLPLPSEWLPQDANLKAAKFTARLSPLFGGEVTAIVNIRARDPERLVGCIVIARTPDGNQPMTLQKHGRTFLLMPVGEGSDRSPRVMQDEGDWSIVGQVIRWMGEAPAPA